MNTKHQVVNRKIIVCFTKAKHVEIQNKKATHTEAHITEISKSRHNRKTGNACGI